jgi:tetratricopeptide (TPR) repeat protein
VKRLIELSELKDRADLTKAPPLPVQTPSAQQVSNDTANSKNKKLLMDSCGYCGMAESQSKTPFKACSRCKLVRYCSVECQAAHWKRKVDSHKDSCYAPSERTPGAVAAAAAAAAMVSVASVDSLTASLKGTSIGSHNNNNNSKHNVKECGICLELLLEADSETLPSCAHQFHKKCIETLKRYSHSLEQVCPLCRTPLSKNTAEGLFQEALLLTMRKQYAHAIVLYKKAVVLDPKHTSSMHNLAFSYLHVDGEHANNNNDDADDELPSSSRNVDEAIKYYKLSISLSEGQTKRYSLTSLADILYRKNKYNLCKQYTKQALDMDPTDSHALEMMGHLHKNEGKFHEALACYKYAVQSDPNDIDLYYDLAQVILVEIYIHNGYKLEDSLFDEAIHMLRKALELKCDEYRVWLLLGGAMSNRKRKFEKIVSNGGGGGGGGDMKPLPSDQEIRTCLQSAEALISQNEQAVDMFNMARDIIRMVGYSVGGGKSASASDFDKPCKVVDMDMDLDKDLGNTLIILYSKCMQLQPDDMDYVMNITIVYRSMKLLLDAEMIGARYNFAVSPEFDKATSLTDKAIKCEANGQHNKAQEFYEKAFAVYPLCHFLLYHYGRKLLLDGKFKEALGYLKDACYIFPNHDDLQHKLGFCYFQLAMDDSKEAEPYFLQRVKYADTCFNNALILNGRNNDAWSSRGILLAMMRHDNFTSMKCFSNLLAVNPNHATVRDNLKRCMTGIQRQLAQQGKTSLPPNHIHLLVEKLAKPLPSIKSRMSLYELNPTDFEIAIAPSLSQPHEPLMPHSAKKKYDANSAHITAKLSSPSTSSSYDMSPSSSISGGGGGGGGTASSSTLSPPHVVTKQCSKCSSQKPSTGFSKTQWKKKANLLCKDCTE